jgi:hypothetical protein
MGKVKGKEDAGPCHQSTLPDDQTDHHGLLRQVFRIVSYDYFRNPELRSDLNESGENHTTLSLSISDYDGTD